MPRFPRISNPLDQLPDLLKFLVETQVKQPVDDAVWAFTNPIDRLMGRGRAEGGQMAVPFLSRAGIPIKSAPSEILPGYSYQRVPQGGNFIGWTGEARRFNRRPYKSEEAMERQARLRELFSAYGAPTRPRGIRRGERPRERGVPIAYNLLDELGKTRGSIKTTLDKDVAYVDEIFVDPSIRNNAIFQELAGFPIQTGKEIEAAIVNPRLALLAERLINKNKVKGYIHVNTEDRLRAAREKKSRAFKRNEAIRMKKKLKEQESKPGGRGGV